MANEPYRGWDISYDPPPIPIRQFDWQGTHPDYDGDEDSRFLQAATLEELKADIDEFEDEG